MTHAELVARAARWLKNQRRCVLVCAEPAGQMLTEMPDAIGWPLRGGSILVECKTTLSDMQGESRKPFRRHPMLGMGRERYYMVEPGWLPEHYPLIDRWGLLEVRGRNIVVVKPAEPFDAAASAYAEQPLMVALVRRREGIMPTSPVFAEPMAEAESAGAA